ELALSRALGPARIAANAGLVVRRPAALESEVTFRLGAGYRFGETERAPFEVDVSLAGTFDLVHPFQRFTQNALELKGQVGYDFMHELTLFLGGGVGLTRGWGTPDYRLFTGLRFGTR